MDSQRTISKLTVAGSLLVVFILCLTFLCRAVISAVFDITLDPEYWYRDFFGNLVVALVTALLVQSLRKTVILAGLVIVMFQLGNAAKLSILGTPASPDDFLNIQNVFFLFDGWRRIALFAIASLPVVLALVFMPWKRPGLWVAIACLGVTGFTINAKSDSVRSVMDKQMGNSVWNQPANYRHRGLALHLAQETVRTISKVERPPTEAEVRSALQTLTNQIEASDGMLEPAYSEARHSSDVAPDRNVHVFVLESFFDPVSLGEQWVPEDPFPEEFRELWQQTGKTLALTPVFGGYTANSEFEVLCGFPVTLNAVFFEGWLRNSSPCLPRVLSQAGYQTLASHPNVPGFWNRTSAYQLIGFDDYRSKGDFDLTDSVGTLLLDHSMYTQVFEKINESDFSGPVFNYMLTYHGHLPYPGNDNYPDMVKPGKESTLLNGYLNQLWYKSRDLMQRLALLRKEDPDALIVIFGDHLPFLGPNYGVYTEAWELPDTRDDFTGDQLRMLTSTPLIIIDGERGPLNLGKMPLYRLPSLITSLLGLDQKNAFDSTRNPNDMIIRPVYGMHYAIDSQSTTACTDASANKPPCIDTQSWLNEVKIVISDLFTGEQFSLQ